MSALEKMREAFETCTVMAGVEPDFECIYITKNVANALFDEAEAENNKLRELVKDMWLYDYARHWSTLDSDMEHRVVVWQRIQQLGIEVNE